MLCVFLLQDFLITWKPSLHTHKVVLQSLTKEKERVWTPCPLTCALSPHCLAFTCLSKLDSRTCLMRHRPTWWLVWAKALGTGTERLGRAIYLSGQFRPLPAFSFLSRRFYRNSLVLLLYCSPCNLKILKVWEQSVIRYRMLSYSRWIILCNVLRKIEFFLKIVWNILDKDKVSTEKHASCNAIQGL